MSKQDSNKTGPGKQDSSALSTPGKIAAAVLIILFAIYLIFLG